MLRFGNGRLRTWTAAVCRVHDLQADAKLAAKPQHNVRARPTRRPLRVARNIALALVTVLAGSDTHLVVLVAPFTRANRLVRKLPLVGYVVGGTFTTVPVSVSGDIRKPLIVPLGPEAITSQVLGIFERTFKLPGRMLKPLEAGPTDKPQAAPQ
jgi:hypothetical protein